jgi:small membrane protein
MLIQYILVGSSIGLLILFLRKRGSARTAAGTKLAFVLFVLFGIYAALRPGDVTVVAGWLGVGRGTDLLLYALVVVFTFAVLNIYLRFKELELRYARLARAMALQHAEPPREEDAHAPPSVPRK